MGKLRIKHPGTEEGNEGGMGMEKKRVTELQKRKGTEFTREGKVRDSVEESQVMYSLARKVFKSVA